MTEWPERWRCTFSITTMASSTTSPVASVMPKRVSDDGSAPVLQEEEDDDDDDDDRFADGCDDFVDRLADDEGGIDGDDALHAGREVFLEFGEHGTALFVDVEGVRVGELLDTDTDGVAARVFELSAVGFST
jgi:hypothetical protein